jgi:hypothetical protein
MRLENLCGCDFAPPGGDRDAKIDPAVAPRPERAGPALPLPLRNYRQARRPTLVAPGLQRRSATAGIEIRARMTSKQSEGHLWMGFLSA